MHCLVAAEQVKQGAQRLAPLALEQRVTVEDEARVVMGHRDQFGMGGKIGQPQTRQPALAGAQHLTRAAQTQILFGVWRVIFVGLALLALTMWAFFWMKSQNTSDELARSVAVNTLVVGQVFYLLNSRYKLDSSLSLRAHLGNKYLAMGIAAVVILQLLFTYAPPFETLFETEAIPLWVWPRLLAGGLVFFLVVEAEKLFLRASRRQSTAPVPAQAVT